MKYLIIGHKGQLGKEFVKKFNELNYNFISVDINELDITDYQAVTDIFNYEKPDIVVNCAAYNDVDGAENNNHLAMQVNSEAVKYLADVSKKNNALLIHYSSDYVFDGRKEDGLYVENDKVNPLNEYGKSKLAGENNVQNILSEFLIFRLSWVYGNGNQNFIYKFRNWSKTKKVLKISFDEISIPTYTKLIVDITLKALNKDLRGLYHLTNSGYTSRYEWAKLIAKILKLDVLLLPVNKSEFKLAAERPYCSAMDNSKLSKELNYTIPDWEESLKYFLSNK